MSSVRISTRISDLRASRLGVSHLSNNSAGSHERLYSDLLHDDQHKRCRHKRSNIILVVLALVASGLVLTTYFLLRSGEEIEFETSFAIFARETALVAELNAKVVFGQLQSLASTIRLVGETSEQQYPHEVFIPDFDTRSEEIANITGLEMLMFVPFVPYGEQEAWEEFIVEGYQLGGDSSHVETIPSTIYNYTLPEGYNDTRRGYVDTGFMEEILANKTAACSKLNGGCSVPVGQIGPRLHDTSLVMMDLFTHPIIKKEIVASLEYDVPVISEVEDLEFLLKHVRPLSWGEGGGAEDFDYSLPRSFTLDPVKADFGGKTLTVGYVVGIIQWNSFFAGVLPTDTNGIVINVESDCGRSFYYVVNGGKDDEFDLNTGSSASLLANDNYQRMEQRYRFFWKDHPKGKSRHCHFDLVIAPSNEFADAYKSNGPLKWTMTVFAVGMVLAIAFFIYDNFNRKKRDQIALERKQAEAVVTSLFPEQIGRQLMKEQGRSGSKSSINIMEDDSGSDVTGCLPKVPKEHPAEESEVPLAELYPSASIMFADLKGFTAWSSDRPPSDVFKLLETIYHEMDELAKKCKVFKIETIGDCYVAVCGLPKKRENHAELMSWFAQQCLERFNDLVQTLDDELPGTAKLELRTGLHCGPVTAGVLRGERARFQLFGDSVNTTARIESTGEGSRIHLSQQFAEELMSFDKGHWVHPRQDKVEAKGKGTLTTFWLEVIPSEERRPSVSSGYSLDMSSQEMSLSSRRSNNGEEDHPLQEESMLGSSTTNRCGWEDEPRRNTLETSKASDSQSDRIENIDVSS